MQAKGVKFSRKVDHGMSHSVYINDPNGYGVELLYELPREIWEKDVDGALNYAKERPAEVRRRSSTRLRLPCSARLPRPRAGGRTRRRRELR
jgi:hypothetical protein